MPTYPAPAAFTSPATVPEHAVRVLRRDLAGGRYGNGREFFRVAFCATARALGGRLSEEQARRLRLVARRLYAERVPLAGGGFTVGPAVD